MNARKSIRPSKPVRLHLVMPLISLLVWIVDLIDVHELGLLLNEILENLVHLP